MIRISVMMRTGVEERRIFNEVNGEDSVDWNGRRCHHLRVGLHGDTSHWSWKILQQPDSDC
jgi:hypothetical protein